MGTIKLDLAPYGHECGTCQSANYRRPEMAEPQYPTVIYALTIGKSANYRRPEMAEPQYPTVIYALTIGAGYRQPSYLCPNCLGVLRVTLGVKNQRAALTGCDPQLRVLSATAPCVMEGE